MHYFAISRVAEELRRLGITIVHRLQFLRLRVAEFDGTFSGTKELWPVSPAYFSSPLRS